MRPVVQYLKIVEARCKRCGPRGMLQVRERRYELPVIVSAAAVEDKPWRCGRCRGPMVLDIEEVRE